jgi:hypothetical protein
MTAEQSLKVLDKTTANRELRFDYMINKGVIWYNKGEYFLLNANELKTLKKIIKYLYLEYKDNNYKRKYIFYNELMIKAKINRHAFQSITRTLMPSYITMKSYFSKNGQLYRKIKITNNMAYILRRLEDVNS